MKKRHLLSLFLFILTALALLCKFFCKPECCTKKSVVTKPYNTLKDRVDKILRERSEDILFTGETLLEELGEPRDSIESLFGMSVEAALDIYRLVKAEKLLKTTDDTISCIAETTGFGSSQKLSSAFKTEFGEAPSRYRELHRS